MTVFERRLYSARYRAQSWVASSVTYMVLVALLGRLDIDFIHSADNATRMALANAGISF